MSKLGNNFYQSVVGFFQPLVSGPEYLTLGEMNILKNLQRFGVRC